MHAGLLAVPRPGNPAFIFLTSGSSGKPRGVIHSHDSNAQIFAQVVAASEPNPVDLHSIRNDDHKVPAIGKEGQRFYLSLFPVSK